ncbi:SMI1/KNR4 family protein [Paenibacillus sp. P13VS]|uniref:SMI1/KNR4 family protein n=1 Tax=Paenibacillus sp. P13VS TaxID=2697367 RepID=UPI00187B7560|nr:SMI1/KNR4 family protein [Paenibacillus sp. P13VS]MBE7682346.1 SMI1/KNR4 family protein [Paenibacillus sp. P13VS]
MYKQQLERISEKLQDLRSLDAEMSLFGAENHEYVMERVWTPEEITGFEQKWMITLPEEYGAFLLHIGSGGAGPYYGLEKPEDGVYAFIGYDNELNAISDPFPYVEAWNWEVDWYDDSKEEEEWEALDHDYLNPKRSAGLLRISDFGCGISMNLVLNGPCSGEIWTDDRANRGGIYPDHYFGNTERLHFLDWYELWLDRSIHELNEE